MMVTPAVTPAYERQSLDMGMYTVQNASEDISFVYNRAATPRVMRRVTLSERRCTCAFTDQHGIPCKHIIAALNDRGTLPTVFAFFQDCYQTSSYSTAFKGKLMLVPIETEVSRDPTWLPAVVVKRK